MLLPKAQCPSVAERAAHLCPAYPAYEVHQQHGIFLNAWNIKSAGRLLHSKVLLCRGRAVVPALQCIPLHIELCGC